MDEPQAAAEHSAALGWNLEAYREIGGMFVVRRHEIDYHHPAFQGDELICLTWPTTLRKSTAHRRHVIRRVADGETIAEGLNLWAYVDAHTHRPARIPQVLRDAFDPNHFCCPSPS